MNTKWMLEKRLKTYRVKMSKTSPYQTGRTISIFAYDMASFKAILHELEKYFSVEYVETNKNGKIISTLVHPRVYEYANYCYSSNIILGQINRIKQEYTRLIIEADSQMIKITYKVNNNKKVTIGYNDEKRASLFIENLMEEGVQFEYECVDYDDLMFIQKRIELKKRTMNYGKR